MNLKEFFSKPLYIALVLGLVVLILGGVLGYEIAQKNTLRKDEKEYKAKIKDLNKQIEESEKHVALLIDSAGIYKAFAEKELKHGEVLHANTDKIIKTTQDEIRNVDTLPKSEQLKLFSKFASEYTDSL